MSRKRRSRKEQTCYMCDRPASSREHVPPKCFFPAEEQFRRNLITVPSCRRHNLSKSGDDQYLCATITTHFENNPIAAEQFSNKVMPALLRRPRLLGFFADMQPAVVEGSRSGAFMVDLPRFERAIDHIARGIYYYHYREKARCRCQVMTQSIFAVTGERRDEINKARLEWRSFSKAFLSDKPRHGENPDVFYYQAIRDDETGRTAIRLVFYRGFVVDTYFPSINADETPQS